MYLGHVMTAERSLFLPRQALENSAFPESLEKMFKESFDFSPAQTNNYLD